MHAPLAPQETQRTVPASVVRASTAPVAMAAAGGGEGGGEGEGVGEGGGKGDGEVALGWTNSACSPHAQTLLRELSLFVQSQFCLNEVAHVPSVSTCGDFVLLTA